MTLPLHYGEVEEEKNSRKWSTLGVYLSAVFFFAENTHNFAQCCVNSPRISEKNSFEKTVEERGEKGKKHVAGVW